MGRIPVSKYTTVWKLWKKFCHPKVWVLFYISSKTESVGIHQDLCYFLFAHLHLIDLYLYMHVRLITRNAGKKWLEKGYSKTKLSKFYSSVSHLCDKCKAAEGTLAHLFWFCAQIQFLVWNIPVFCQRLWLCFISWPNDSNFWLVRLTKVPQSRGSVIWTIWYNSSQESYSPLV